MTYKEAIKALITQAPIVYRGLTYKKISGLIYRKKPKSGGMGLRLELQDMRCDSVTVARHRSVEWKNESDRTSAVDIPPQNEDGPTPQEAAARAAFWSGHEVLYKGDRCIVSAMIVRNWINNNYWLDLELARVSDGLVRQAWSGSVIYHPQEAAGEYPTPQ